MTDLVERLRSLDTPVDIALRTEAADEIDRLHAVQAMEKYWQRQYQLARAHLDKIRAAIDAPPKER